MTIPGFLAVFIGAGSGAVLRWWLGIALNPLFPTVPMGTLAANLSGGYMIGLAMGWFSSNAALPVELRLLITTGFLGGLTTFSTFSGEVVTLIVRQQFGWAAAAAGLHLFGSLACTALGLLTMQWLKPAGLP